MSSDVYAALGFVKSLTIFDRDIEYEYTYDKQSSWTRPRSKHVGVLLARTTSELLIVTWKPKRVRMPVGYTKQKQLLHTWSHWFVSSAWQLSFKSTKIKRVGTVKQIEYWSDKFTAKNETPGQFRLYQHSFKKKVPAYSDKLETVISINHPRLLSERGIIA